MSRIEENEAAYISKGARFFDDDIDLDEGADTEFLRCYWLHQYDRLSKLEEQRLTFTNIVVATSVVAMAIVFDGASTSGFESRVGVFGTISAANLIGVGFVYRMKEHVAQHLIRARIVLKIMSPELFRLNIRSASPKRTVGDIHSYQMAIHGLLAMLAIVAIFYYN